MYLTGAEVGEDDISEEVEAERMVHTWGTVHAGEPVLPKLLHL